MNNDKSYFNLKDWGDKVYPIVIRPKGSAKIDECPFCEKQHMHSAGDGHRYSQCSDTTGFFKEIEIKGSIVLKAFGYFIEEY
jgi:hypothetical protein